MRSSIIKKWRQNTFIYQKIGGQRDYLVAEVHNAYLIII